MNDTAVTWVLAAIGPWLMVLLCLQRQIAWRRLTLRGWLLLIVPGVIALGILLIPVDGIVVARWVAAVSASFSVPLTGVLAIAAWERAFRRPVFAPRDWNAAWAFGAIGGLVLYPFALGVGSIDPYEWGWHRSPLFVIVGGLTAWLIWKHNRFGVLLLLAVIAFHLQLFEASNYWDYLLDPLYCLASFVVLVRRLLSAEIRRTAPT